MPPRPFPQALSIGTDICHYIRFQKYLPIHQDSASTATATSSHDPLFKLFDKFFLPAEQRMFWRRFRPSSSPTSDAAASLPQQGYWDATVADEAARYIGGRWAAKEAVIKAFAAERRLMLRDVRVQSVGKSRQPLGLVLDEIKGVKHASAKEVYEELVRRWGLREELKTLRQRGEEVTAAPAVVPSNRLRIIKQTNLNRATARGLEMAKRAMSLRQDQKSSPAQPAAAAITTTTTNPPILSKSGILDLSVIHEILQQDEETSTTSAPSSSTLTSEADAKDTRTQIDSRRQRLEEEVIQSQGRERREDDWDSLQGQIVKLSISHDGEYCVATALAAV
ncbi:hypothetical protein M436DRAFT_84822 [Aureobasidium namibiae CBS 147.97]|uniref:4'-phosphopantetheinyl transferase domain-containing protein n=1 Tax=Aureobasidium namibiae CBS 147.97 TaxID=1043004 RepID=A0A074WBA6_9PEZI